MVEAMNVSAAQKDERLWGMLCHLTALVAVLGIPFGNIVGPLVVWLIKKNSSPFVDEQGKNSLNFQITVAIACLVSIPLMFLGIGILLLVAIGIADLVFVILASVKANQGESYKYPVMLKFIK